MSISLFYLLVAGVMVIILQAMFVIKKNNNFPTRFVAVVILIGFIVMLTVTLMFNENYEESSRVVAYESLSQHEDVVFHNGSIIIMDNADDYNIVETDSCIPLTPIIAIREITKVWSIFKETKEVKEIVIGNCPTTEGGVTMNRIEKLEARVKIKYPSVDISSYSVRDLEMLDDMKSIPKTAVKTTLDKNKGEK